jgi:Ca2+-binding EF-hand superfamily protein
LKEAFAKTGKELSENEIKKMLERHVIKENGNLGFEEFKMIFF